MAKYPSPCPLFDTLEKISESVLKESFPDFIKNDFNLAMEFLQQYSTNKATFESYRREIEKFLQWSWLVEQRSVTNFKRQEIESYLNFCFNPPQSWTGTKTVPRFINQQGVRVPNPAWRPFITDVNQPDDSCIQEKSAYKMSQKTIQAIFSILSTFYNYLILEEKASMNPVALIKQKSKYLQQQQTHTTIRRLSEKQWDFCLKTANEMADTEPKKHERILFILGAMYLLYLRISELVESKRWMPQMGHFYRDSSSAWWFKTVGKGNKMRDIAVSDDMINALKRYRISLGLSPLPAPNDNTPLLPKEKGTGGISSTRRIRQQVQACFDKAIQRLSEQGFEDEANALKSATAHWLRHTGISDDINKLGRPIAHVQNDAGHNSPVTTNLYNDIELSERYKSAKGKKMSASDEVVF